MSEPVKLGKQAHEKPQRYWSGAHTKHRIRYHLVFIPKYRKRVLKGGSSRVLRAEFPELAEFLWGSSFWAVGYFAATVSVVEGSVISEYIRAQQS